jgi:manganese efflux pump family protein
MAIAALITWIVTAGFGFTMLGLWLRAGGTSSTSGAFRPPVVFGHFLLAAAGLVLWVIYLISDADALTWVAFVVLVLVAVLGDVLVLRWNKTRRGELVAGASAPGGGTVSAPDPAPERHIPAGLVGAHGVFAVATVVLVFLTALGVGGS